MEGEAWGWEEKGREGKGREGRRWEGRGREGSVVESKKILKIDPAWTLLLMHTYMTNVSARLTYAKH